VSQFGDELRKTSKWSSVEKLNSPVFQVVSRNQGPPVSGVIHAGILMARQVHRISVLFKEHTYTVHNKAFDATYCYDWSSSLPSTIL